MHMVPKRKSFFLAWREVLTPYISTPRATNIFFVAVLRVHDKRQSMFCERMQLPLLHGSNEPDRELYGFHQRTGTWHTWITILITLDL
jgi:hypothetical protein